MKPNETMLTRVACGTCLAEGPLEQQAQGRDGDRGGVDDEVRGVAQRTEQRALGGDAVDEPAVALQRVAAPDLLEPADQHGVGRLEEQQPGPVAAGVEVLEDGAQVRAERAAAHVHHHGDAGDVAPGAGPEVDHRGDQLGGQVVDDEPAQVLQDLRRGAAAGPGQPADQRHLDAGRLAATDCGRASVMRSPRCRGPWAGRGRSARRVGPPSGPPDRRGVRAVQGAQDRDGRPPPEPGKRGDLVDAGGPQLADRPEVLEQRRPSRGAEPGDAVERRGGHALGTTLAVVGDGEAVRLVPDPLQQVQPLAGAREDHRVRIGRQPDLLQPLGQPADRDVGDAELGQHVRRRLDLGRAAVDDEQVRRVGEAARPAGGRVDARARRGGGDGGGGVPGGGGVDTARVGRPGRAVTARLAVPPAVSVRCRRKRLRVTSAIAATSPPVGAAADLEAPVVRLAGQPVLEHHQRRHDVRALHVRDVDALDAQRRAVEPERVLDLLQRGGAGREVAGAAQLVLGEGLLGVALDGLGQRPLVAALGHADLHAGAAQPAEPLGQRVDVRRQLGHEDLPRHGLAGVVRRLGERRLLAVELREEPLDQRGRLGGLDLVDHPAALAADPAAAHVEDLHRGLQLVLGEGDDVGVRAVAEHHGLALHRPAQRAEVVAQPGGPLELQLLGGGLHAPFQLAHQPVGAAGEELAEVVDDVAVLVRGDPADARRGALVDVAEQAGPPDLAVPAEHPGAARAGGEDPQQEVERLADGPGVGVRTEVAHPLAAGPAVDVQPGELLPDRHREHGVGLVVAVADVEPRVELLDPVVLELERLDLGAHHRPLHPGGGRDHLPGARMQVARGRRSRSSAGCAGSWPCRRRSPGPRRRRSGTPRAPPGWSRARDGRWRDQPWPFQRRTGVRHAGRHRFLRRRGAPCRGRRRDRRRGPRRNCRSGPVELCATEQVFDLEGDGMDRTTATRRRRWGASASCWRGPSGRARPRRPRPARTRPSS